MGQQWCTPTITATMAITEMVNVTAMATAMMPPLQLMAMMSTTMTAVIQGRQLDDGNLTTMMGQQQCMSTMTVMTAMVEMAMATAMATVTATATAMVLPPLIDIGR